MGPTGSGKTALALSLAEKLPISIINVDSAQVYRGMDIGTAKPSTLEQHKVPHYLVDIRDPTEPYSAAQFCDDASRAIQIIHNQHRIPLLVGGTMLYFRALQQGLTTLPSANPIIRAELNTLIEEKGLHVLHDMLLEIDPVVGARIHPNDAQRICRALELHRLTGKSPSELYATGVAPNPSCFVNIVLLPSTREKLIGAITERFDTMLDNGWVAEVQKLAQWPGILPNMPSLRAVGYRQLWRYIHGAISLSLARELALAATRQLVKRQLTWLRRWPTDLSLVHDDPMRITKTLALLTSGIKRVNRAVNDHTKSN